ncbi:ankyrin repeat domain-containing protein [Thiotrichales bacterium 19S3-7]|nr:ankyrin repeat domain-containing protein [Thiotrichales bacterium 19S3-7]MCF6803136.1 ankyrin repeat domain-containing protein [Thiotrichales bacterium 19S3-11]
MSKELLDAITGEKADTVKILLELPETDVNYQDEDDMTALHYAAMSNNSEIIRQLLEKGADVTKKK